jgi:hypothetical protein
MVAPMKAAVHPVDWNRDGQIDLVANGWWWRATERSVGPMPVYERGGKGALGYPLGSLDGDDHPDTVVIRDGRFIWLEDTASEGPLQFTERGPLPFVLGGDLVLPDSQGITDVFDNWSISGLGDLDSDGRTDILVIKFSDEKHEGDTGYVPWKYADFGVGWIDGQWIFNSFSSTLWWHRNVGTPQAPRFTFASLVTAGVAGRAIDFPRRSVSASVLDWNKDGKNDVFVHAFDRSIVFLHTGPSPDGDTRFDDGHTVRYGEANRIAHRKLAVPYRADDGRLHVLFHGGSVVYEAVQTDADDPFRFSSEHWVLFENPTTMMLDIFPVPDVADWDGDGRLDLIVGSEVGFIWWLRNLDPEGGMKRWAPPTLLEADGTAIRLDRHENLQGPEEYLIGYSNPTAEDWDLDGDLDIVAGCHGETYYLFENIGSARDPKLTDRGPLRFGPGDGQPVRCAWRSRPGVGDVTGDGLPDLIGVDGQRRLCLWRRHRNGEGTLRLGSPEHPVDAEGHPFLTCRPSRGIGRSKFVVVDWNRDGRADILSSSPLGDRDPFIYYYENLGMKDGRLLLDFRPQQIKVTGHVREGMFTHYNMLEPVDFDGDGEWEGVAGMDNRHPAIGWAWLTYWPSMERQPAGPATALDGPFAWPGDDRPAAVMVPAPQQGEVAALEPGEAVFRNRKYRLGDVPAPLRGKRFIRGDIEMGFAICERPGLVYVLAPEPDGVHRDCHDDYFVRRGFRRCEEHRFRLFGDDPTNDVAVLWKQVEKGEKIVFGRWAVVVF